MHRTLLVCLGLLGIASMTGCELYFGDDGGSDYSYCDSTGCYECDDYGCWQVGPGGGGGWNCSSDADCAAACWCDTTSWNCLESSLCSSDADCADGRPLRQTRGERAAQTHLEL